MYLAYYKGHKWKSWRSLTTGALVLLNYPWIQDDDYSYNFKNVHLSALPDILDFWLSVLISQRWILCHMTQVVKRLYYNEARPVAVQPMLVECRSSDKSSKSPTSEKSKNPGLQCLDFKLGDLLFSEVTTRTKLQSNSSCYNALWIKDMAVESQYMAFCGDLANIHHMM